MMRKPAAQRFVRHFYPPKPSPAPVRTDPIQWAEPEDIIVTDQGQVLYSGPKYVRCTRIECLSLVTQGMVQQGGCWCGNRRVGVVHLLTKAERRRLKAGYYPLTTWEQVLIAPEVPAGKALGWGKEEWDAEYAETVDRDSGL